MLVLDTTRLPSDVHETELLLRLAFRESLLHQAPLYISPASTFTRVGDEAAALRTVLGQVRRGLRLDHVPRRPGSVARSRAVRQHRVLQAQLSRCRVPPFGARRGASRSPLTCRSALQATLASKLAERFRLTPGQIRHAVAAVEDERLVHDAPPALSFERLAAASREQAQHELSTLAVKIAPAHRWPDLVLPDPAQDQLVELCGHIRNESLVFDQWGFGARLTYGRGVSALFSGPPGTGKTMAAEVIASELQLDLFQDRPLRGGQQVHRRDREEPRRIFDAGRGRATRSCSSTRPMRCSASAPRSRTPRPLRQHRDQLPAAADGGRTAAS